MKNKGFTLIELLAVIVILAIISLIAVPILLNVVEKSRKGAAIESVNGIISSAEKYYAQKLLNNNSYENTIDLTSDILKYKGNKPEMGTLLIDVKGKIHVIAMYGKYCIEKKYDDESPKIVNKEECTINGEYKEYTDGEQVYFNPTTGKKCTAGDVVSTTGTNTGCMRFYTFNDSKNSSKVNMILDHNTTTYIAWNSSNDNTDNSEIMSKLNDDTSNWISGLNVRLISAEEIAAISGNTTFNIATTNTQPAFYFRDYGWLYNNLVWCSQYGCENSADGVYGYWTTSPVAYTNDGVWYVHRDGSLQRARPAIYGEADSFGIRPVITVDKSLLD